MARREDLPESSKVTKTVAGMTAAGTVFNDKLSQGIRPDTQAAKQLPYACDVCPSGRSSFLTATQLSDHLKSRHGVNRHPSIIRPSKGSGGGLGAGGNDDLNL